jgi:hypothetical protein
MEDVIEDRSDEEDAKCVEETYSGGECDGGDDLEPIPAGVMQQTPPTFHCVSFKRGGGNEWNCTAIYLFYRLRRVGQPIRAQTLADGRASD